MHGDFSRLTFRPDKRYSAVLTQQGRIQLDADGNEQAAITEYLRRTLIADLIGPHAGPVNSHSGMRGRCTAFEIGYLPAAEDRAADLTIGAGRYYVDGLPADATVAAAARPVPPEGHVPAEGHSDRDHHHGPEAPRTWTYWTQPDAYLDPDSESDQLPGTFPFLVYLRVAERFISAVEDPGIREIALGPAQPDTAGRVKVTWQVLTARAAHGFRPAEGAGARELHAAFEEWAAQRRQPASRMAARAWRPEHADDDDLPVIRPQARYRGPENQLYRIEVHRGGTAGTHPGTSATFKWSRDNGSVIFPVAAMEGPWVSLASLGRDDKLDLHIGDRVEIVDDAYLARGAASPLPRVEEVDVPGRRVRLSGEPGGEASGGARPHPYLRRWDQQASHDEHSESGDHPEHRLWDGALRLDEGTWLDIEDGVRVWFAPGGEYRTGDYWLIPARALTGDVEWPRDVSGTPLLEPPDGISCHYAPLAWITGPDDPPVDLRSQFRALTRPVPPPGWDPDEE